VAGANPRRQAGPQGLELEGQVLARLGPLDDQDDQVASLLRSDLTAAAVEGTRIQRLEACTARGSSWKQVQIQSAVLCDLRGARLQDVRLHELVGCSLRGAVLRDCRLDRLVMVDLSEARLERVQIGLATTVDLGSAELVDCQLQGADLRGALLRRARLEGTDLSQALVAGADLAGIRGLDREARRRLLQAGVRFRAAAWHALLRRLLPTADTLRLERLALLLQGVLLALGGLLALAALVAVLIPPPVEPVAEPPPPLPREATAWEVEKTREHLARLRDVLQDAHLAMVEAGAEEQSWPSMLDFQQNQYDIDGDGPSEVREPLVPGGMPDNLLTDAVGSVLPYCNEEPSQGTISGVDTDWHYCELSGRIFACAGYTGLETLDW